MKKDEIEILDFDYEFKPKVGRPKLADKETKKRSIIIASVSFFAVVMLVIFGYGTLVGFNSNKVLGNVNAVNNTNNKKIIINEIKPLVEDITLKEGTARKVYLTVSPAAATDKTIVYKSSDENIAVVDKTGKVTGISEGEAIITASTKDGSNLDAEFNIKVIKNAEGKCEFTLLKKSNEKVNYEIECDNANVKEIQYKIGNGDYEKLLTKKLSDSIKFSEKQLEKKVTLKVVYYPNNSRITKYSTRTINTEVEEKQVNGSCDLIIKNVNSNSARYDIACDNATISKIAYKIGNGSYVGIDNSSLADTILFEESDVTRQLYFNIEYVIDGTNKLRTITRTAIIEKGL